MTPHRQKLLNKIFFCYMGILLIGAGIFARLVNLKVVEKEHWEAQAQVLKEEDMQPNRGNIYTRNHHLLASAIPLYDLHLDFSTIKLRDKKFNSLIKSLADSLALFFQDKPAAEYLKFLRKARQRALAKDPGSRYILFKRNLSHTAAKRVKSFPLFNKGWVSGGLITEKSEKRIQPNGRLAQRTIGYYSQDGIKVGLEDAYNAELAGIKGKRLMQIISGRVKIPFQQTNLIDPIPGQDIVTTLDIRFQDIADKALEAQLIQTQASHGCAIIMEVQTGDIKAMVNLKKGSDEGYHERYNTAIGENLEPGSTFKLASLMAALEDGVIELEDTVQTGTGSYQFYDRVMRDSKIGGHGQLSFKEVFAYSSNVGIAKVINQHYKKQPEKFLQRLHYFGLDEKTNIDIRGEKLPAISNPNSSGWSGTSLPWMSLGYEVKFSPLQILNLYNTVANQGVMVQPHLLHEIQIEGKTLKQFQTQTLRTSICSEATILKAQEALEAVVEFGTARQLKNPFFKVAGKTGTAQLANKSQGYRGKNEKVQYLSSFAGYFPADEPRYSCIVVINSPQTHGYYAAEVAVPVFKTIMHKVYALEYNKNMLTDVKSQNKIRFKTGFGADFKHICKQLKIETHKPIDAEWVQAGVQQQKLHTTAHNLPEKLVPDFTGMGLRDALYLVEKFGLKLRTKGSGKVVSQSLKAGSIIQHENQIIYLELHEI